MQSFNHIRLIRDYNVLERFHIFLLNAIALVFFSNLSFLCFFFCLLLFKSLKWNLLNLFFPSLVMNWLFYLVKHRGQLVIRDKPLLSLFLLLDSYLLLVALRIFIEGIILWRCKLKKIQYGKVRLSEFEEGRWSLLQKLS